MSEIRVEEVSSMKYEVCRDDGPGVRSEMVQWFNGSMGSRGGTLVTMMVRYDIGLHVLCLAN